VHSIIWRRVEETIDFKGRTKREERSCYLRVRGENPLATRLDCLH
jgi:hypothetical protein